MPGFVSSVAVRGSYHSSLPSVCVAPSEFACVHPGPAPIAPRSRPSRVRQHAPRATMANIRIGHGFDLHRLEPGLPLILGGVTLEHDRGCAGHSDGDAVYHCAVDAVLGALSLPDIGQLFPDTDPRFKDAASHVFMTAAYERMAEQGYGIGNIDVTIILERPKLSPHKARIRQNIADLFCTDVSNVNVKAKTHEKVDALGENRAVSVHAVALLSPIAESTDVVEVAASHTAGVDPVATGAAVTNQILQNVAARASSVLRSTAPPAEVAPLQPAFPQDAMQRLYSTVRSRKGADPSSSWTAKLFAKGRGKIAQKVGEEAVEVVIDATSGGNGSKAGVVKESADLLYHLSVLWADMDIEPEEVWAELAAREGVSGIAEKSNRPVA